MALAVAKETEKDQLRQKTLDVAKRHKASWIELGQYLYSIHKDKLFKGWGYLTFEGYCKTELGIKETTAAKLLKSYYFLEKEEPQIAKGDFTEEDTAKTIPNYESVNILRLAKENKNIAPADFADLRSAVIDSAKEPKEVKAQYRKLLSDREVKDPVEVRKTRRNAAIKRLITILDNTKHELGNEHLLPDYLLKQIDDLKKKLQDQLE
ncbi:MAG: hypothetical protein A3G33_09350 [Omnitrophica bacterium RIFCSPLOWO2_12_FULL_44_17]|uniref:Uncharacterized protein n=1 Tax=Candidatus Danuiimicrobium aquiferis TaxID=1801832 RepID=A0A1G1KWU7_9BACT|nr:MAG: hypothetical protein A3B72_10010 [Omnitrophica bacterium RIFCSPHIGHO2_02_FULL_45_28]OGW92068.1 MAG: hypothetical protein A3E74_00050 [Omnitrophica bacterium RIFCSPHIGHO2_12_FULL_44_12]OGW97390.1 MAG: hypothetical protein A3G33_09350 [Omnitrophica bacterium RIFCSPLOWO2_12_FULL_44_17]OGX04463.1 MAG: hypothetical protein A3J12_10385 [Omnitrophica bacterium RIFCSPLOWO2_02_FULL_44_11]